MSTGINVTGINRSPASTGISHLIHKFEIRESWKPLGDGRLLSLISNGEENRQCPRLGVRACFSLVILITIQTRLHFYAN